MQLNLAQIGILLHYRWSPEEYPGCEASAPWRRDVGELIDLGLLKARTEPPVYGATYETTERGTVYVEAIRELPLPVQKWVMP